MIPYVIVFVSRSPFWLEILFYTKGEGCVLKLYALLDSSAKHFKWANSGFFFVSFRSFQT